MPDIFPMMFLLAQSTGTLRQATESPRSGAGVGVGMLMVLWFHGFMVSWFYGLRFYGFTVA